MAVSVDVAQKDLLVVQNLKTYFPVRSGVFQRISAWVKAVDDVSFTVKEGETFGLVGESGCGKTTVSRSILRLIPSNEGTVFFDGQDVLEIGTGHGNFTFEHLRGTKSLLGIDIDREAIENLKNNWKQSQENANFEFLADDIVELSLKGQEFDVAVFSNSF